MTPVGTSPVRAERTSISRRLFERVRVVLIRLLLVPVHLWRSTAMLRAPRCRYHPTCSSYAIDAVRGHGPLRGTVLATRRVCRCHPWNLGGLDPVPDVEDVQAWRRRHSSPPSPTTI